MAETVEHRVTEEVECVRRISWGAIIAGVIIVLIVMITLSVFGIAIGLTTVDIETEEQPAYGLKTGSMIWWIITGIVSLFCGGWAAGRLSGLRTGILHGIVTWGLVELVMIYMLTSAIGAIIGGAMGVVRTSAGAAVKAVPQVVGQVGGAVDVDVPWQQIQKEVRQILQQTGQEELQPEQIEKQTEQARREIEQTTEQVLKEPQQGYDQIMQLLDKLLRQAQDVASEVDKQAVVNVLTQRTNMSQQQAQETVDKWINMYQQAAGEVSQTAQQLKEKTYETAEQAAATTIDVATSAAWWSFFMLILGAIAAALGGALGTPDHVTRKR